MGLLLQILFIGLISFITFLALYTLLIFIFNFIHMRKDSVRYFKNNKKDILIFSNTSNETANSFNNFNNSDNLRNTAELLI